MSENTPITEKLDSRKISIDQMNDYEALSSMLESHSESYMAVRGGLKNIEEAVSEVYFHLKKSDIGRLIYCGAGTSARIGVQDGAELFPTFGWPKHRVGFLIAGGKSSLFEATEGAEDNTKNVLRGTIDRVKITKHDVLIAIAASGNTPFTCAAVKDAKKLGALTLGISNNENGILFRYSNLKVFLDTGPEIVAGSTRLKAGTSQKICLNLISTLLMCKMGRVKNGYMSHMVPTNQKLRLRKEIINNILKNRL